jgi:hypothetical protein
MKTETEPAHDPLPEKRCVPVQLSGALAKKRHSPPVCAENLIRDAYCLPRYRDRKSLFLETFSLIRV